MNALLALLISASAATTPVRVDGDGYLRFSREGRAVFAKAADLVIRDGKLANKAGDWVMPTILTPNGEIEVTEDGTISVNKTRVGRLVIAIFTTDTVLSESNGVLVATGRPRLTFPTENGAGKIMTAASAPSAPRTTPATTPAAPVADAKGIRGDFGLTAEVEEDEILVRHLANLQGEKGLVERVGAVKLGPTPMIGVKREFDREQVLTRIRAAGFKPESMVLKFEGPITVTRKAQAIPHQRFVETAEKAVLQTQGITVSYKSSESEADYLAPQGRLNLVVETIGGVNSQTLTVVVGIYVEGKRINSRTVKFQAVSRPVAIRAGQAVRVRLKAGGAVIEAPGQAMGAGKLGEAIPVEVRLDAKTRSTHQGKVIEADLVEVTL